ncbi:MAG: hypothetical protein AAEJ04_10045 [Planctomycetota bacterium]
MDSQNKISCRSTKSPTRHTLPMLGSSLMGFWFLLLLLFTIPCDGQVFCDPVNPSYGTCFVQTGSYPGELAYAATVIDGESSVLVSDYLSGIFYKFPIAGMSSSSSYACPLGPATYLGVAWNTDEDVLYWIVNDQGSRLLVTSSSGGNLISQVPLTLPAGVLTVTGLTWNPATGNFWTNDLDNDVYHELLSDGSFTGNSFSNPAAGGAGAFGLGLTSVLDPITGDYLLDLPVGPASAQRANQVIRVDESGNEVGLFYPLASVNSLTGYITGIAWSETGSWGGPSDFVVDLDNNMVVEVAVPNPNAPSVSTLNCSADGDNNVTLSWLNPITYTSIQISRDGEQIAEIGPGIESFVDEDLDSGTHQYDLKPIPASGVDLPAATCQVVVGFGRLLGTISHGGSSAGPSTVIESSGRLLVADESGLTAWLYEKDLTPVGSIPGPFSTTVTLSGLAWNSSNDTIAWLTANGDLRITDLAGVELSASSIQSPSGGLVGEICWSNFLGRYLGLDRSSIDIFEFDADGTVGTSTQQPPGTATGAAAFLGGITDRGDSLSLVIDVAVGSLQDNGISRIERSVDGTKAGLGFDLAPSANSGEIVSLSSSEAGPFGTPVSYVVGKDTGIIYMLSANLAGTGSDFVRGEVVVDGTINLLDVTQTLLLLFDAGQDPSECLDALDSNDDGLFNIADAISTLEYLFQGGTTPPAPNGACGTDDSIDNLTCQNFDGC